MTALTIDERVELARCEDDIRTGLQQAWRALREIHDKKLWRGEFPGFGEYVETRWGFSRQRAYQLIDAADLIDEVSTTGLHIENERVARAALEVPEPERVPVLILAHKSSEGQLDSGWIKSAATVYQDMKATRGMVDDGEGSMTEAERAVIDDRLERAKRQRQHIADGAPARLADFIGTLDQATNWLAEMKFKHGWQKRVRIVLYEAE